MYLVIPSVTNPIDRSAPIKNACGRIASLSLEPMRGLGGSQISCYASKPASDVGDQVLSHSNFSLGQIITAAVPADPTTVPPTPAKPAVAIASLAEMMKNPEFANAYLVMAKFIYTEALKLPEFQGATIV
ncbi:MAG: hypothetical protein NVSMB9_28570 [Isosphaeraceae bacterium]